MAKDISISIASETRAFQKGVKDGIIEPLDGAVESIEDLGKAGDDTGEQLSDSMKDAQRKTELLGDEYTELRKKIDGVGKQGKDSFKEMKDASDKAKEGVSELKDESNSTAKEAAASFDGSAESIVDAFQEVAANAFSGFGPAGALAGLAIAAGIGIATSAFNDSEEAAGKAKERIQQLSSAFMATRDASVPLDTVIENLQGIVSNSDDARVKFKDLKSDADKIGVSAHGLALAYAEGNDVLNKQLKMLKMLEEQTKNNIAAQKNGDSSFDLSASQKLAAIQKQIKALEDVKKETQAAQEIEKTYLESGAGEMQAKRDFIMGINNAYDDVVGSVQDYIDKESGVLDVEKYIEAMQKRSKALSDYQTDIANSGLTTEQKTALNDMGIEAAMAWMQGYKSATPAQQEAMRNFLTESAKDSSGAAKTEIENAFKAPVEAQVEVQVNPFMLQTAQKQIADLVQTQKVKVELEVQRKGSFVP